MEPTPKNPNIDKAIYAITGVDRIEAIKNDLCAFKCDEPDLDFRNDVSKNEYRISGICQQCQDNLFGRD